MWDFGKADQGAYGAGGVMLAMVLLLGSICVWFSAALYAIEGRSFVLRLVCGVGCFFSLAWLLAEAVKYEDQYPCLNYETTMQYNPAIKTMMPMRHCIERGEWVNP